MFKLDLEKPEEPEIKMPTSVGSDLAAAAAVPLGKPRMVIIHNEVLSCKFCFQVARYHERKLCN